jgi:hypothetical protein
MHSVLTVAKMAASITAALKVRHSKRAGFFFKADKSRGRCAVYRNYKNLHIFVLDNDIGRYIAHSVMIDSNGQQKLNYGI